MVATQEDSGSVTGINRLQVALTRQDLNAQWQCRAHSPALTTSLVANLRIDVHGNKDIFFSLFFSSSGSSPLLPSRRQRVAMKAAICGRFGVRWASQIYIKRASLTEGKTIEIILGITHDCYRPVWLVRFRRDRPDEMKIPCCYVWRDPFPIALA